MNARVTKECKSCGIVGGHYTRKNESIFPTCVVCNKKTSAEQKRNDPNNANKQRARYQKSEVERARRAAYMAAYRVTVEGAASIKEAERKSRKTLAEKSETIRESAKKKKRARQAVCYAISKGKLLKPQRCENCNTCPLPRSDSRSLLEGHHFLGYEKENYLDVRWLCRACHSKTEWKYS